MYSPEEVVDGEVLKKYLKMFALPSVAHRVQGGSQETPTAETCNVRAAGNFVMYKECVVYVHWITGGGSFLSLYPIV